jgi:hypothetical protein
MLFLRWYLWIAPHVLLGIFVAGFLRRRLQKQMPFFFSYLVFDLFQFIILFCVGFIPSPTMSLYRWILVCSKGILSVLQLAVIYELANELLLSRSSLAGPLRTLLRWAAAVLFLVVAIVSGMFQKISVQQVVNALQVVDFSSSVVRCGLLIVLFLFTRALQISWRSRSAGIALGFGIMASVELVAAGVRGAFGRSAYIAVDLLQMAGFHVCVLIWLAYLFLPERTPKFTGKALLESDMEVWDQQLQKMLRP